MSRRRFISTEASIDEVLNSLGEQYGGDIQLFYLMCIPHSTDDGILRGSVGEIRNRVFPSRPSLTKMVIARFLYILHQSGLIIWDYENDMVLFPYESFYKYQTYIPTDRRRKSDPDVEELPSLETILEEIDNIQTFKTPQNAAKHRETPRNAADQRKTPQNAAARETSNSKDSGDDDRFVFTLENEENASEGGTKEKEKERSKEKEKESVCVLDSKDLDSKDKDKDKDKDKKEKEKEKEKESLVLSGPRTPPPRRKTGVMRSVRYKYPPEFEEFWKAYGKPGDKALAYECYQARIAEGDSHELIMEGTRRYKQAVYYNRDPAERDLKYLKNASTFLGPRRYYAEWAEIDPKKMNGSNRISEPSEDSKIDTEAKELKMFGGNVKLWERWKRDGKPADINKWRTEKRL